MKMLFLINNTVVEFVSRKSNGNIKAKTTKTDADGKKVSVYINAPARMFETAPEQQPKKENDLSLPLSIDQLKKHWSTAV